MPYGTKGDDVRSTIAIDPGYYTAVLHREGHGALNWATIGPTSWYQTVDDFELLDEHVTRIMAIVGWFEDQYRHHAPFTYALELVATRDRREANRVAKPLQITARIVQCLMRELSDRDLVLVKPHKDTGSLHRGHELPISACYPSRMYGRRGESPLGAPAWDGAPVALGPNDHPENSNVHARAAYDIAAFAHRARTKKEHGRLREMVAA